MNTLTNRMSYSLTIVGWLSIDVLKIKDHSHKSLGGAALYSTLAAAKYIDVDLISVVGADFPIRFFNKSSVNTKNIKRINGESTSFIVSYDKDWRASYECVSEGVGIELTPLAVNFKSSSPYIYISPMSPNIQFEWVKYCTSVGMKIALGTNMFHTTNIKNKEQILKMIPFADVFVCNKEESKHLFETDNILKAAQILGKQVKIGIITADKDGCVIIHENEIKQYQAIETNIIDPSGAGDVFIGSFLGKWRKGYNIDNAINSAILDASKTISSIGIENFLIDLV